MTQLERLIEVAQRRDKVANMNNGTIGCPEDRKVAFESRKLARKIRTEMQYPLTDASVRNAISVLQNATTENGLFKDESQSIEKTVQFLQSL